MQFTLETVVVMIVIMIVGLILLSIVVNWGGGTKNSLDKFFGLTTGAAKNPPVK